MLLKSLLRKNSLKLCYNGYDFTCSYISLQSTKWVCTRKKAYCKARLSLSLQTGTIKVLNFQHNHDIISNDKLFKDYQLIASRKRAIKEAILKRFQNKLKIKKKKNKKY